MQAIQINRFSARLLLVLSILALCTVFTGYFQAPQPDEGTAAHLFQLTILLSALTGGLFVSTADWRKPAHMIRPLIIPAIAMLLAFAALYSLANVYFVAHPR